jgi:hypothetical protein
MSQQSFLALFDDEPSAPAAPPIPKPPTATQMARVRAALEDPAVTVALAYEAAVLGAMASFRKTDLPAQAAACLRFADQMERFMGLAPDDHARGESALKERRKITGREWQTIQDRMLVLNAMPAEKLRAAL